MSRDTRGQCRHARGSDGKAQSDNRRRTAGRRVSAFIRAVAVLSGHSMSSLAISNAGNVPSARNFRTILAPGRLRGRVTYLLSRLGRSGSIGREIGLEEDGVSSRRRFLASDRAAPAGGAPGRPDAAGGVSPGRCACSPCCSRRRRLPTCRLVDRRGDDAAGHARRRGS